MELIRLTIHESLQLKEPMIGIIGQFDGLHIGHMKLIEAGKQKAHELKMKTALITFDPHPDYVLGKRENIGYITPLEEKLRLLEDIGLDAIVLIDFSLELSRLTPLKFYEKYLSQLSYLFVGTDYRYGHFGKGNVATLKKLHPHVEAIPILTYHQEKISSNNIRELIMTGKVDEIYTFLERYYNITGVVEHGDKVGRTLGVRTANIELVGDYQMLRTGVYAVRVTINQETFLGVCNIGHNPTLNYIQKQRLEVHIIGFEGDLYHQILSVDFLKRLRDEVVFPNRDDLIQQIRIDIDYVKEVYGEKR
ncbi:MAG: riboflavin biosynthesis protein RibF [Bacilli bacterium]|nr:riboflavin biosynthesis protein RibF [Bacilli bacterium]